MPTGLRLQLFDRIALLLFMLAWCSVNCKAQYYGYLPKFEQDLKKIDKLYQNGNLQSSLKLADSIEPLIAKEYGDTNFYYGYFVSQNQAMIHEQLQHFQLAENAYKKGIGIMEAVSNADRFEVSEGCINLGNLYFSNNLLYQAKTYIEKGRASLLKIDTAYFYSNAFAAGTNNLGNIYMSQGNYYAAENLFDTAMIIIDSLIKTDAGFGIYRLNIYNNIAGVYCKMGDFEKGVYFYLKAYEAGGKNQQKKGFQYNAILSHIGFSMVKNGEFEKGLAKLYEVKNNLESNKTVNQNLYLGNINSIIDAYSQQGKMDSAIKIIKEQIDFFSGKEEQSFIQYYGLLNNYASCLINMLKWREADSVLSLLAATLGQHPQYEEPMLARAVLSNFAKVKLHTGQHTVAIALADSLWAINEKIFTENYWALAENEKFFLASSLYNATAIYAAALYGTGMKDKALIAKLFEKQSFYKGRLLEKQNEVMKAIKQSQDKNVQQLFEEWKSNNGFLGIQYKLAMPKRSKLTDSIAYTNEKIEKALKINSLVAGAAETTSRFKAIKERLASNECLLEFIRFGVAIPDKTAYLYHYGAFIVRNNQEYPQWVYLGKEEQLTDILGTTATKTISTAQLQQIFIDPRLKKAGKIYPGAKLYQLLFKPILPLLHGITIINCVSDGLINNLPIGALPLNDMQYIADRFTLKYFFASGSLLKNYAAQPKAGSLSLWGGINYGEKTAVNNKYLFKELPRSFAEVSAIKKCTLPFLSTESYTGKDASEENFKNKINNVRPEIIHLSSHGYAVLNKIFIAGEKNTKPGFRFIRTENPLLNCGLAMANANSLQGNYANDGLLTGYEIADLDLSNTQLAVLSACETGLGSITETEGVFGLQRAFKLAGVQKIMMSLWAVNDKSTSELMISFYDFLAKGYTYEKALQAAKNETRKKYPSPYYWAGFEIIE